MPTQAYLDWNATAPLRPEAQAAVIAALAVTGNPSSVHAAAAPRGAWWRTRASRSRRWSAPTPRDVVFTSGGTEANMLALSPALGDDAAGVGDRASFGAERRAVCRSRATFR